MDDDLRRQTDLINSTTHALQPLEDLPLPAALINSQRQILYGNHAFAALLGVAGMDGVVGRRVGEAVQCQHSDETPGGCGTTEFCTTCGAGQAINASQRGVPDCQEGRIVSKSLGGDLDLRVWARPFAAGDETFTLLTLLDIRDEKRRQALERIFFHDVLNTAGGIHGLVSLLADDRDSGAMDSSVKALEQLSTQLIEEIKSQRDLVAMEQGDLAVEPAPVFSRDVLDVLVDGYRQGELAARHRVNLSLDGPNLCFVTDARLVRRVVGNMIKNAIEACPDGGTVRVTCEGGAGTIRIHVHNPSVMPRSVQLQVFQRSFSTKGAGRGIGTYGMKLLTERYLGGRVSFTSSEAAGTTFTAEYPLELPAA